MRYGIISDIHSNIEALTAIRKTLADERIDSFVCLGDIVGYGASPNECCEIVRDLCDVTLLGNHDAAVAGRMDYSFYYEAARHALDWSAAKLSPEHLGWLRGLPYTCQAGDVGFSHGSPIDPEAYEYIFALEQAQDLVPFTQDLPEITFIGHSHLCKAFALDREEVHEVVSTQFEVRPGMRYIVSVGSVGQPRDYDPRASYVIYDSKTRLFEFKRVAYDIESAARKIFDSKLERNFGNRLFIGV